MSNERYIYGFRDSLADLAELVREAECVRFLKTPSGRTLYLLGSSDAHHDDIAEVKFLAAAGNAAIAKPD